jgi:sporulation protein YlmC with PRC-barrel domain
VSNRALLAACLVALAGPAAAQTAPTPAPQAGAAAPTFYAVQPSDMPLSNLYDLDVYNQQNENVGEIEDIIVDGNRTIRAYVLSVGGFLGFNERYVTEDAGYVTVTRQGDKLRAVINASRDDLRNAPAFKFEGAMRRIDD